MQPPCWSGIFCATWGHTRASRFSGDTHGRNGRQRGFERCQCIVHGIEIGLTSAFRFVRGLGLGGDHRGGEECASWDSVRHDGPSMVIGLQMNQCTH